VNTLLPISGAPKIMLTHAFEDGVGGVTRLEMRVGKPKPKDKAFVDHAAGKFKGNITKAVGVLRSTLEKLQDSSPVIDDPPLKPPSG
jgi:hypothetical protein